MTTQDANLPPATKLSVVRAMTFNVRGSFHRQDEVNAWPQRRELHLATIEQCDPDIIGFQEVQSGNFDAYKESYMGKMFAHVVGHTCKRAMHWSTEEVQDRWASSKSITECIWKSYDYVAKNVGSSSQHDEHVPIYWRKNRFELLKKGCFYLSETPEIESISWESKLLRAATWVCLRERSSGAELLVCNTHFPHEKDDRTRTECAKVILQQMETISQSSGAPIIMMGDFNCHAGLETDAYASFLEHGFEDTYFSSDYIDTFHHFLGQECPWNLGRIDWILTKNGEGKSCTRIETKGTAQAILDAKPPLYPSDHYPILVELSIALN